MYLVRLAGKNQHAIHVEILGSDPHCAYFLDRNHQAADVAGMWWSTK